MPKFITHEHVEPEAPFIVSLKEFENGVEVRLQHGPHTRLCTTIFKFCNDGTVSRWPRRLNHLGLGEKMERDT